MDEVVLAADLGGTNMRMAAITASGEILHLAKRGTPDDVSPSQLIDISQALAAECREAIGNERAVGAVGFASPAPAAMDCDGILTKLPNLPSLNGMDLASALREAFSLPITLE